MYESFFGLRELPFSLAPDPRFLWPSWSHEEGLAALYCGITRRKGFVLLADVAPWVRDGRVRYRETVVDGLENAPAAFIGLLAGENIGKMLVKVGPEP